MFKKISKNILLLLFANAVYFLFSFLAARELNHALDPAALGVFNLVTFYLLLIQNLADLGQSSVTAREISQDPRKRGEYFWNSLYLRLLLFSVFFVIVLAVTPFIHKYEGFTVGLLIGTGLVITGVFKAPIDVLQQVDNDLKAKAASDVVTAVVKYLVFYFIVINFVKTPVIFMTATSISGIVWFLVDFLLYRKHIPGFVKPNKVIIKLILVESVLIGLVITSHYLAHEVEKTILDLTTSAYEVGIYSAAQKILALATVIPGLIMIPIFPEIARNINSKQKLRPIFNYAVIALTGIGILVSIGIFGFADFIINLVSGAEYTESVVPLKILSIGIPFVFWQHLWGYTLISFKKIKPYFWFSMSATLVNIVFGIILCQLLGAIGASITFVISEAVVATLSGFYVLKKLI